MKPILYWICAWKTYNTSNYWNSETDNYQMSILNSWSHKPYMMQVFFLSEGCKVRGTENKNNLRILIRSCSSNQFTLINKHYHKVGLSSNCWKNNLVSLIFFINILLPISQSSPTLRMECVLEKLPVMQSFITWT